MRKRVIWVAALMAGLLVSLCPVGFAADILVKEGVRGEAVRHVQELLIEQGYLEGEADGICGKLTVDAIRRFQKANRLEEDGVCGRATYLALSHGQEYEPPEREFLDARRGKVVYVEATAYSAQDPGLSSHTSTGTLVRRGVIAVDPTFIPLGTHVFIPGYGEAVAEDVGWGIKGNLIDVAFDTHEEALAFGRKDLEIYIVED